MTANIFLAIRCAILGSTVDGGKAFYRPLQPFRNQHFFVYPTPEVLHPTKTSAVA